MRSDSRSPPAVVFFWVEDGSAYGTGRREEIAKSSAKGRLSIENRNGGYEELLANIRRLTVMVLDNLEARAMDRTLDQGQKRLLSSTGARLLRLWRAVLREGGSQKVAEDSTRIEGVLPVSGDLKQEGVDGEH